MKTIKIPLPPGKHKRWTFTIWNIPLVPKSSLVDFFIYQSEFTEKKQIHYQGYIEFKKEYSAQYVKSLFKVKDIHLEVAREDRIWQMWYCFKGESYAGYRMIYHDGTLKYNCSEPEKTHSVSTDDILDDVFDLK